MTLLSFACQHQFSSGFELDIQFEARHRVTCLFGPSGSGKSTVLSMIAGMIRPQSGSIRLGERVLVDVQKRTHVPVDKREIGFVFQDHRLFPHMTVLANLHYGYKRSQRQQQQQVEFQRVVDVLELDALLTRYPRNLSGGQRQRVSLGRALLSGPQLLLMDEPLAALDDVLKHRILDYLDRIINEWEIATLFVSHSQEEVRRLADWVVVVNEGRIVTQGTSETALGQPQTLGWKNALAPVNLLRIDQAQRQGEQIVGRVGKQQLNLPHSAQLNLDSPMDVPIYVRFAPADVTLCRHDVQGLSVRNHLSGLVRQVVKMPDQVFVAVDIGQILWAEVTGEAAAELKLADGSQVHCLIKTNSLHIV